MHQAITETHAYKAANNDATQVLQLVAEGPFPLAELERGTFQISETGTIEGVKEISLTSDISHQGDYFREIPQLDMTTEYGPIEGAAIIARTEPVMTPLRPRLLYTPSDTTFLNATLSFEDKLTNIVRTLHPKRIPPPFHSPLPTSKKTQTDHSPLQILKRFSYLTNHPIPDPLLSELFSPNPTTNTLGSFLTNFSQKVKRKPAKVAEQLLQNEELAKQSNLLILGRRETPVDKEKELGRWKVIERELRSRGLPVLGKLAVQR